MMMDMTAMIATAGEPQDTSQAGKSTPVCQAALFPHLREVDISSLGGIVGRLLLYFFKHCYLCKGLNTLQELSWRQ